MPTHITKEQLQAKIDENPIKSLAKVAEELGTKRPQIERFLKTYKLNDYRNAKIKGARKEISNVGVAVPLPEVSTKPVASNEEIQAYIDANPDFMQSDIAKYFGLRKVDIATRVHAGLLKYKYKEPK